MERMRRQTEVRILTYILLLLPVVTAIWCPEVRAEATLAVLRGVTRDPGGFLPSPRTGVTMRCLDDGSERSTISDADGMFQFAGLEPGRYQVEARKRGFGNLPATRVTVAAGASTAVDLLLGKRDAGAQDSPSKSGSGAANSQARKPADQGNFFRRIFKAYADDWKGSTSSGADPERRLTPAPVDGPPFPFSDWPYGGSVVIGAPWTQSAPLMQALWSGPDGDAWKKSGVQIYGWLNGGFNVSTSSTQFGHYGNAPAAYYLVPNSFQPDQEVLYIERQPDTVQTDHFDWGFRFTNLYGMDYRFTTAKGYFSQQLLGKNKQYGYDLVMAYVDLYCPQVADGMNVRIGRYISLPDIEAQLAPNNYTYSHSLLYTFDAYTQTGINATVRLNDHWMVQAGLSAGNDVAPWVGAPDAKPTFNTCVAYSWQDGRDTHYACLNSLNSGKYAYNNIQSAYYTWYHKFGSSSWHTDTEYWYMWETHVPNVNPAGAPAAAAALLETNANGAWCDTPTELTCRAPEQAVVNYVEKQFSKHDYFTIRNEFFDDAKGQRTGFKTNYSEHLLGWGHWIGTTVLIRPELRYEHSYALPVYSNGTRKDQLIFASDVVFFF
jgi:Putative beta-barrel porin-2, OmpL-like. bbp2/Carboxypeptidase regulatory-like domain